MKNIDVNKFAELITKEIKDFWQSKLNSEVDMRLARTYRVEIELLVRELMEKNREIEDLNKELSQLKYDAKKLTNI